MQNLGWWHVLFGKLSYDALPFYSGIATFAAGLVVLGALTVVALLTYFHKWGYFWSEWITSLDHKRTGIIYIVLSFVMMSRALIEAAMMRAQQALAYNAPGFLPPDHFSQLFTTHGTVMIFFMGMPFLTGLINYVMPLQIGSRDVAFPMLNSVSLGTTAAGAGLMMVSLCLGKFSTGGWSGYPPFTELQFSPGVGPDYWIWAVTLSSVGSTMSGINFAVTIYKKRAPGMHLFRMPLFCWTTLCTSILMIFAMPALTVATALLACDRYLGMHFFTNADGGNMMNYANLFWLFGHPEVYIRHRQLGRGAGCWDGLGRVVECDDSTLLGVVQIRVTRETWNPLVGAALATLGVTHKPPVLNHARNQDARPPTSGSAPPRLRQPQSAGPRSRGLADAVRSAPCNDPLSFPLGIVGRNLSWPARPGGLVPRSSPDGDHAV